MDRNNDNRRERARQRLAARQGKTPVVQKGKQGGSHTGKMSPISHTGKIPPARERRVSSGRSPSGGDQRNKRGPKGFTHVEQWRSPSLESINMGRTPHVGAASLLDRLGNPFVIMGVIVVILLLAVILLAFNSCSNGSSSELSTNEVQSSQQQSESAAASASASASANASSTSSDSLAAVSSTSGDIDKKALMKIVDEDVADKLINRAASSDDALWIAQNTSAYSKIDTTAQAELLELAADEPAAQSYVRAFPDKYPMETPDSGQVKTVTTGKNVPRFYQWDSLWGYTSYAGTAFGLTGGGPTCLAMVYQCVMQKTDLSPYDMGLLATQGGYSSDSEGTYVTFFTEGARSINLSVTELDATEKALKNALQSGQVIVVGYAPGQITDYEHYVVISGMNQDGSLVMNDPYSEERSNKTWDISSIVNEGQVFYAYGG